LPGPFFVEPNGSELPEVAARGEIAAEIYDWYQRHVSSEVLVRGIAKALGLTRIQ